MLSRGLASSYFLDLLAALPFAGRLGGHRLGGGNSLTHQPPRIGSRESARCVFNGLGGAEQGAFVERLADELQTKRRSLARSPAGTARPGNPAMFTVTVKMSSRYIASGSPDFSPNPKAGDGVVGVSTKSTLLHASSKSR